VVHHLHGRAVMPGLIDSHTHGLWGACQALFEVFPGLGADLAQDLAGMAAEEIAAVRPEATLFAGRVVFGGL
jgi:predicted amidohydrolase YtcJ